MFVDRRESFTVQAVLMAAVAAMVVSGLMLVWFLDHPYGDSSGSIRPVEMERSIAIMEQERSGAPPVRCGRGSRRPTPQ